MRKGLTTLMTVAIALASVSAMAMAPVIGDIPSPIVGNKNTGSMTVKYTYRNAFDLNAMATDDQTLPANLAWSYEFTGTQKYAINGDQALNSGSVDPVILPATDPRRIDRKWNTMTNANETPSGTTNSVTIRNIWFYPYGGTPATTQTTAVQNWANNSQAITFWCSDGNLATSKTVMFYTDNTYTNNQPTGWNRLTTVPTTWKMEFTDLLNGSKPAWHENQYERLSGPGITTRTLNANAGICFEVNRLGDNWGSVVSPMPAFNLAAGKVYRIRARMNSSQLPSGAAYVPFWDFAVSNWNGDAKKSANFYGMDTFFLANQGAANAVTQTASGTDITLYWAPLAFNTKQWTDATNGAFTATNDALNDPDLHFRVMDIETNQSALQNNLKFGAICLQQVVVESIDYTKRTVSNPGTPAAPIVNITTPKAAFNPVPPATLKDGNMRARGLTGSTAAYTGGILKITPSGNAVGNELVTVVPANDIDLNSNGQEIPPESGVGDTILDDWPMKWNSNWIYEMIVKMSAPTSNDALHPYDVMWFSIEPRTWEVDTESFITAKWAVGTPKTAATAADQQPYIMFYNSMNETKSAEPSFHQLRWRIRLGNSTNMNWPNNSDATNTGAVNIHSVVVNRITFPN